MSIEGGKPNSEGFVRFEKRPHVQNAIQKIQSIQPEVVFDVFLGQHKTYDQALTPHIATCDLFIPEAAGWPPSALEAWGNVSQGKDPPYACTPFAYGTLNALYDKKKGVKFIDLPAQHPNSKLLMNLYHNPNIEKEIDKEIIEEIKTTLQDKREEYMISQLPQALLDFIEEAPKLAEERQKAGEPIKVLLFLGAVHTRISHALKEANPNSTRTFSQLPFIYPQELIDMRKTFFGTHAKMRNL